MVRRQLIESQPGFIPGCPSLSLFSPGITVAPLWPLSHSGLVSISQTHHHLPDVAAWRARGALGVTCAKEWPLFCPHLDLFSWIPSQKLGRAAFSFVLMCPAAISILPLFRPRFRHHLLSFSPAAPKTGHFLPSVPVQASLGPPSPFSHFFSLIRLKSGSELPRQMRQSELGQGTSKARLRHQRLWSQCRLWLLSQGRGVEGVSAVCALSAWNQHMG